MTVRDTLKMICTKKPFTPWFTAFVGVGTAVGAGPNVPMWAGVSAGVVLGMVFSLWRMR